MCRNQNGRLSPNDRGGAGAAAGSGRASGLGRVHALWFSNRGRIVDSASHKRRMREGEKKGGRRRDSSSLAFPFPSPFLGLSPSPGGGRISERCSDRDRERERPLVYARAPAFRALRSGPTPLQPPLLSSQSLHEMPIRYCYTRRGEEKDGGEEEISAIFFLLSHAAPHNDFGVREDGRCGRWGGEERGAPCRGWAIYCWNR